MGDIPGVKHTLEQARDLIRENRFNEARNLLKTIDHPTARDWLNRIDEIEIARRAPRGRWADKVARRADRGVPVEEVDLQQPPREAVDLPRRTQPRRQPKRGLRALLARLFILSALIVIGGTVVVGVIILSQNRSIAAIPVTPTDMARYFPADTLVYGAMRTDDAQIDNIDAIIQRVTDNLPMEMILPLGSNLSVRGGFDQLLRTFALGDFQTSIRPWLGEWAAFGVYAVAIDPTGDTAPDLAIAAAVHIRNRNDAAAFIARLFGQPVQTETRGGYAIYRTRGEDFIILLGDEVMFFANEMATGAILNRGGATLYDDPTFQQTFAHLPESDYGLVVYANMASLMHAVNTAIESVYDTMQAQGLATQLLTPNPGISLVYALALRDGNTILLDAVQVVAGEAMALLPDFGVVDPTFMDHVPSNAVFVMHASNLRALIDSYVSMFETLGEIDPAMMRDFEQALQQIDSVLMTVGGFTLQEGVLDWLTGDYALFAAYEPAVPDVPVGVTQIQGGIVIEATDPVRARAVVDAFANAAAMLPLERQGVVYGRETVAGADSVVFTASDGVQSVDVVVASNDTVFVIGTRAAAEQALSGTGGLYNSADYSLAQSYYSGGQILSMYLDGDIFTLMGDVSGGNLSARAQRRDIQTFYDLARIFRFMTTSASFPDEGVMFMRMVLRLTD